MMLSHKLNMDRSGR